MLILRVLQVFACRTHRANILLDKHFNAKLGDFGFAFEIPDVKEGKTFVTAHSFARTEGYYPPEIVRGQISPKSDVYSYGVVSYISKCSF